MLARVVVCAVTCAALALCAAACGSADNGPTTLPTPSEASTPAGTATAVSPTQNADAASAEQFVRTYFQVFNEGQTSGDMSAAKALASSTCTKCVELTDNVERYYSQGHRVDGGAWQVKSVTYSADEQQSTLIDVTAAIEPATIVDSVGGAVESYEGTPDLGFLFNISRNADNWIIVDLVALGPRA